jgi:hypothetical protein
VTHVEVIAPLAARHQVPISELLIYISVHLQERGWGEEREKRRKGEEKKGEKREEKMREGERRGEEEERR